MKKASITIDEISALVLCGGAGRRFGGADKPLALFNGDLGSRPMLDYVIHRLPKQARVFISANRNLDQYAQRGHVVSDAETGLDETGPLVGIYAGLVVCPTPWLLVCPGDMPLLPQDWHGLLLTADCAEVGARVLHDGERLQSLLCLLPTSLTTALGEYIRTGGKSVKAWHALHHAATIRVSESQNAFANINTEAELDDL